MIKLLTDYVKCMHCGEVYHYLEPHPISAEFVNGYPTPCEYVGRLPYIFLEGEVPYLMRVVDRRGV